MSFQNQPPHMYSFLPPPSFIHPPLGSNLATPVPPMLTKPLASIPPPVENNIRFMSFEKPITTVFIGNISDKIPDSLLKEVLGKCGNVLSWKRVQGASGKMEAFGFCEYDNPEATLRCMRLLNLFSIAEKSLVVKVDPKTDDLLTEYKNKKQKAIEDREAEDVSKTEEAKRERINAFYAREKDDDNNSLNQMKKLIKEYNSDLLTDELDKKKEPAKNLKTEEIDLDDDRKNIITREIESFRNKHKDDEMNEDKEERFRRSRDHEKEKRKEIDRNHEGRSHRRHRSRSISKSNKRTMDDEHTRKRSRANSRASSIKSKKRRSESNDTNHSKSKSKNESEKEIDEYDAEMYRKLEKKLREKESAYQTRLKMWEGREKKKTKDYELDEERKVNKDNEIAEEARKLQIFFEDYDDEKWDIKYYRGTELERRYNARRTEESSDERDRSKELEQIEQTKQRLIRDDDPNAESIILQMEQSMQEHLQKRLILEANIETISLEDNQTSKLPIDNELDEDLFTTEVNHSALISEPILNTFVEETSEFLCESREIECKKDNDVLDKMKPDESLECQITSNITIVKEDEQLDNQNEHLNNSSSISTIERNAMVKKIIDGIPTLKADLFAYPIEWKMVDDSFVESRIKPWVDKKIATYIGEEEPSLSMFICKQVLKHRTPDEILSDIAMVLEEEADVFVMKMWRLLIYVIEERKCGLDK